MSSIIINGQKLCYKCGQTKSVDEFYKNKNKTNGYADECKSCDFNRQVTRKTNGKNDAWYAAVDPSIIKHCITCHQDKSVLEFVRNRVVPSGFTNQCKQCYVDRKFAHIIANIKKLTNRYANNGVWLCNISGKELLWCQVSVHHPSGVKKEHNVGSIIHYDDIEQFYPEIDQCIFLSTRVHHNLHSDPNLSYTFTNKSRKAPIKDRNVDLIIKKFGGLENCRCVTCYDVLRPKEWHWHHRDPSVKRKAVSTLMGNSFADVWNEILKCDLMCADCHVLTYNSLVMTEWYKNNHSDRIVAINRSA